MNTSRKARLPHATGEPQGVGFILPSPNTVVEDEVSQVFPPDVPARFTRIRNTRDTVRENREMLRRAPTAAAELADARVAVLVLACTSATMLGGLAYDRHIRGSLTREAEVVATTTASSVVAALKGLGAERIALVAPYRDSLIRRESAYIEESGIQVAATVSLNVPNPLEMALIDEEQLLAGIARLSTLGDALFISCTNLHTLQWIQHLEHRLEVPIVTSNQATFWWALRAIGRRGSEVLGRLAFVD